MASKKETTGILLVNLGTPDSPKTKDVRTYLRQFLMDHRVIDIPFISRWLLVHLIIAPFRGPKSAKIYQKLWTANGSPLKIYGERNEKQLQISLGQNYHVKLAMRYQQPSIESGLLYLREKGVSQIKIIPLFPQYASSTVGSIIEEVNKLISTWQTIPAYSFVNNFYNRDKFIQAFADNALEIMKGDEFDHFLFSYHGTPERHITKGDHSGNTCKLDADCCLKIHNKNQFCYRAQCFETTRLLARKLGLNKSNYTICFQSRLGKDEWIKPYAEETIKNLAESGVKSILAFSPAFVADCLETTIEVGQEFKEIFLENGGEKWKLVPSLNDSKTWIELLKELSD